MRYLLLRLRSLGDIILSTPVARAIRGAEPGARISYLVEERFRDILTGLGGIDEVISYPAGGLGSFLRVLKKIRGRFDLALDMHGSAKTAALSLFAARKRIGFADRKYRSFLYNLPVSTPPEPEHSLLRQMRLIEPLGISPDPLPAPIVAVHDSAREEVDRILGNAGEERRVIVHPGARFGHKIWPEAKFIEIASILRDTGIIPIITCGPSEESLAERISAAAGAALIKSPSLSLLAALIERADLFIGNDSGPAHLAAALGTPAVVLFGPSDDSVWRPWSDKAVVIREECRCGYGSRGPCRFPDDTCMGRIRVDRVLDQAMSLLDR